MAPLSGATQPDLFAKDVVRVGKLDKVSGKSVERPTKTEDLMASVSVAGRANLTNAQWARLQLLLSRHKKAGRPPAWTKRQIIDGIRW
ncbi:transposase [Nocardia sp. NPDC051750]|uniref:transposase n=1 Tax=Nocardia sp. NPDC051750 TaxID=3364325 RepID=UPI00379AE3D7